MLMSMAMNKVLSVFLALITGSISFETDYCPVLNNDNPVVQIEDGLVKGTTITLPSGNRFYGWRHIPYAKPPVGRLRFQPPERPEKWTTILDGTEDSPACIFSGKYPGDPEPIHGNSEDCLYVNVYSPVKPNSHLQLPVMFWIHGGGFISGTGDFSFTDPSAFMEENVIVVTINYRLSVFGFLSTEDDTLLGNGGLKDQHLALLWTKTNIAAFGGNPNNITIFGQSAGAMSVGYHLISPKSRGLFNAAIMQSGTSILYFVQPEARKNALTLASHINATITSSSTSEDILYALQNADAESLVNLTDQFRINFRTIIEPTNSESFITEPFYEAIESGNIAQVPIIIGSVSAEDMFMTPDVNSGEELAKVYDSNTTLLMPEICYLKEGVVVENITREIKEEYVGNGTFVEDLGNLVNFLSDNQFVRPIMKHAYLQSKYTPVYFYQFTFVGSISSNHPQIPGCGRVAHADDIPYMFNFTTKPLKTEADFLTRSRLVKLWTNFAKTKNPTPDLDTSIELQNIKWTQFSKETQQYLDIGDNLEVKSGLKEELVAFWDSFWENYIDRPYITF